ncbi:hypothetical protein [Thermogemmatispora tikiterensis]|uniref:Uncharacterized protein n=1 Tax=Thermogemmatispora tikiterensis TaxID=1825093 RepID=A0A328VLE7_9CHLR|nr:hypothetical protein [Thermogemmatispora tikiterensis]RAQ95944.1 hypothetical protein A4R35_10395 [Thermogemmatispora tikiterensis]
MDELLRILLTLNMNFNPFEPLFNSMLFTTSPALTTQNETVMLIWRTLLAISDGMLGLVIIVGTIQIMQSDATGSMRMPLGQFVGRILLSTLLMHSSAFLGEQLIQINNLLCEQLPISTVSFIQTLTHGRGLDSGTFFVLWAVLTIIFGIGLLRWLFQAIARIVRLDVLFVLSGPAFLCLIHPATVMVFSAWLRLYVVTLFEQFLQLLAFTLGLQLLLSSRQTGLVGFLLAAAMVNFTASVPRLLERFGAAASGHGALSTLVSLAFRAVVLLA